jgi:hypothetical protein
VNSRLGPVTLTTAQWAVVKRVLATAKPVSLAAHHPDEDTAAEQGDALRLERPEVTDRQD